MPTSCLHPQVEQSYLVLFCTHAARLQDHVQSLVLTILVRGTGSRARSLVGQNWGHTDQSSSAQHSGLYFGLGHLRCSRARTMARVKVNCCGSNQGLGFEIWVEGWLQGPSVLMLSAHRSRLC